MNREIDKIFREALKDHHTPPPPSVWENVSRRLETRKKRNFLLWGYRSAAIIALLLSFVYLYRIQYTVNTKADWESKKERCVSFNNPSFASLEKVSSLRPPLEFPEVRELKNKVILPGKETPLQVITQETGLCNSHTSPMLSMYNITIRKETIPLVSKRAYKTNQLYRQLLGEEPEKEKPEEPERKNKVKWTLSGHFAPGYADGSYHTPSDANKKAYVSEEGTNGVFNMSGGIKVAINADRRFSFHTGIMYTRMGQRTEEGNVYRHSVNLFSAASGDGKIKTPLGYIDRKKRTNYPSALLALKTEKATSSHIEQQFGSIEIPVGIRYKLNDNKFIFSILGGVSGSFLISNKAYLSYRNKKEYIGSTEDIRHFNISTDVGIGVEYPLTPHIKIMLEPLFRYYLRSLSQNDDIGFNPYIFSFSTGIGINF